MGHSFARVRYLQHSIESTHQSRYPSPQADFLAVVTMPSAYDLSFKSAPHSRAIGITRKACCAKLPPNIWAEFQKAQCLQVLQPLSHHIEHVAMKMSPHSCNLRRLSIKFWCTILKTAGVHEQTPSAPFQEPYHNISDDILDFTVLGHRNPKNARTDGDILQKNALCGHLRRREPSPHPVE